MEDLARQAFHAADTAGIKRAASARARSDTMASLRILIAALVLAVPSLDAEAGKPDLAVLLEPIRAKHEVPALAGCIVGIDGPIAVGAVGIRSVGSDAPVAEGDLWHLGSCTKAMTATLLAVYVERGTLSWTATLAELFPEHAEVMDAGFRPVTVAQLLAHRSGLAKKHDRGGAEGKRLRKTLSTRAFRAWLARHWLSSKPARAPGGSYEYSNANYIIAGVIAEKIGDASWEELIRKELFEPLGMSTAGFGPPGSADAIDQPRAHRRNGDDLVPVPPGPGADNPVFYGPAGTVHASLADWARFVALHLRGETGTSKLLKPETLQRLHRPVEGESYAFGWICTEREWAGGRTLTHAGSNTMWYCVAWVAPQKGFAVLTATNVAGRAAKKATDRAAAALIQKHLGRR